MGILHAVYGEAGASSMIDDGSLLGMPGAGALTAPLAATQFARTERWSFQYLASLGISLLNTFLLISIFRFKRQEGAYSRDHPNDDKINSFF